MSAPAPAFVPAALRGVSPRPAPRPVTEPVDLPALLRRCRHLLRSCLVELDTDGRWSPPMARVRQLEHQLYLALRELPTPIADAGLAGESVAEHLANAAQIRALMPMLPPEDVREAQDAIVRREHAAIARARGLEMAVAADDEEAA